MTQGAVTTEKCQWMHASFCAVRYGSSNLPGSGAGRTRPDLPVCPLPPASFPHCKSEGPLS